MSRRGPQELRARATRAVLDMANMIRRVTLAATAGGLWGIAGYVLDDDDGTEFTEGDDDDPIENFGGIHIYARPLSTDNAEAIMLHVGGEADHPVLVGARSEDARLRYVAEFGDIDPGETVLFNSSGTTRIIVSAAGQTEITLTAGEKLLVREKGGTTDRLVTKGEFERHTHATAATGSPVGPTQLTGGALKYTLSLEAELEP